jgi:hypothetical protein
MDSGPHVLSTNEFVPRSPGLTPWSLFGYSIVDSLITPMQWE